MKNRIKELRNQRELTLDDIEAKTGIKRGTYSNYENNKTEPKIETWQKLADFFNVSVPYLQGFPEEVDKELIRDIAKTALYLCIPTVDFEINGKELDDEEKPAYIATLIIRLLRELGFDGFQDFNESMEKAASALDEDARRMFIGLMDVLYEKIDKDNIVDDTEQIIEAYRQIGSDQ